MWAMEVEKHRKQQGNALAWGAGPRQGEVHVGTEGGVSDPFTFPASGGARWPHC